MYRITNRLFVKNYITCFLLIISQICYGCSKKNENKPPDVVTEPQAPKGLSIRVMTYNIHHANPPSKAGVIDLDAIANTIKGSNADLVAIQELDSAADRSDGVYQLKVLGEKTGMYYYFAKAIPYGGGGYGIGILSKYLISEEQKIELPEDPSFTNSEDRALALVKITLPENRTVYFGSTHLDVNREENRIVQAQKIVDVASQLKSPVILGGDLNAMMGSSSMNVLTNYFVEASKKLEPTIPNTNPVRKIDHILYAKSNDFALTHEEVVRSADYASDHLPFLVDLVLLDK